MSYLSQDLSAVSLENTALRTVCSFVVVVVVVVVVLGDGGGGGGGVFVCLFVCC